MLGGPPRGDLDAPVPRPRAEDEGPLPPPPGALGGGGLRALAAGRAYELWVMWRGGQRAVGMLTVPSSGMAGPTVVPGLTASDEIGLTVEPAAGASKPTSAPILVMRLHGS